MNNKQKVFVNEYLQSFNATDAAKKAGYSEKTAYSIGQENLKKPEIAAEIQRRLEALTMSADEVLVRLTEQARGSMEDFLEFQEVEYDPPRIDDAGHEVTKDVVCVGINLVKAKQAGKLHLIKSVVRGKQGLKIELYDAQKALELIGRARGQFVDRTEISGRDGKPIEIVTVEAVKPDV